MVRKVEKDVVIKNKLGIHARPAAMLVQLANKFVAEVYICKDAEEINGKSIIGIMTLAANFGSKLKIRAEGADAEQAVEKIVDLFNSKFGEQ